MLYDLLDCNVIPMSGLKCYTQVWILILCLCLDSNVISFSVIKYYTCICYGYFWFSNFGLWYVIPANTE